ncbi:DUF3168 domain-containing protein [Chitiniphilus eburneus]|uniref:tail completion protein gp17 n=1 Tax=Chitiniphilus eburneus TaxID=2571148 RepID=UPI0035D03102
MFAPLYEVCAADVGVQSVLGDPPRLYPFGLAPQGVALPYAVFQSITGAPENYLGDAPDIDSETMQVNVYADDGDGLKSVLLALRDAIEPHAHITAWGGDGTDPQTGRRATSFDVDWWVNR